MTKKVSIKDIAKELELSITTVSFVINGKSEEMGISEATSSKVLELIKKRDYSPNNAARLLRTGKSHTIGLIVEDLGNYFFGNIAKVVDLEASKRGYNVFLSSTDNNPKTAKDLIRKMRDSSVDGMIITPTKDLKQELEKLKNDKIPFVLLDRTIPGLSANAVVLDNFKGAYDLTRHLLNHGYQNIGFVTIHSDMSQMTERERGYLAAMESSTKTSADDLVLKVKFDDPAETVISSIMSFVKENQDVEALFFSTNYLGVHGIEALKQLGKCMPDDLAVVSFDDNDLFRLFTPSITVASQPINQIAVESIELLLRLIENEVKHEMPINKVLEPELIERQSSIQKPVWEIESAMKKSFNKI
jgi:LacI family transcriptional regulator